MNLNIGDIVVCVRPVPPLKEGATYEVLGIVKETCCGAISIDVGVEQIKPLKQCMKCGNITRAMSKTRFFLISRFVKPQNNALSSTMFSETLEELVSERAHEEPNLERSVATMLNSTTGAKYQK